MSVIKLKKDQEVFKGGLLVENPVYKPVSYTHLRAHET